MIYTDDGFVEPTRLQWIQRVFDILTWIFNRVGLRTNVGNTIGVVCQTHRIVRKHSDASYGLRMTKRVQHNRPSRSSASNARTARWTWWKGI